MATWCSSECTCSNIYLQHDKPLDIIKCRWQKIGSRTFLSYRIIVALWFTIALIVSGIQSNSPKFLIYCTQWSLVVLTSSLVIKAVCVGLYLPLLKKSETEKANTATPLIEKSSLNYENTPKLIQLCWLLNNISTSMAFLMTLVYWGVLLPMIGTVQVGEYDNIHAHLLNTVIVLLDVLLTATPFRLAHVYQPVTFMFLYGAFNSIYWYAGGTTKHGSRAIYPFLDWDKLEIAIPFLISAFFAAATFHLIMCSFSYYQYKSDSYNSITNTHNSNDNADSPV